jgi:hypothetical protein
MITRIKSTGFANMRMEIGCGFVYENTSCTVTLDVCAQE